MNDLVDGPVTVHLGDVREVLGLMPESSIQAVVTSPPYWGLRDYGVEGQLGLEATPDEYVERMVEVFRGVRRVLRDDGTLWLNLGDSYCSTDKWGGGVGGNTGKHTVASDGSVPSWAVRKRRQPYGLKPKDLVGIPWRVAFALQADGWYLRSDIIWSKPNPMPDSVRDRPTRSHEYIFLLSKSKRYYYDAAAVREPAAASKNSASYFGTGGDGGKRNRRTVWSVATKPYTAAHFATYPPALIEPCILAGANSGDTVLDPFAGSGTTLAVARRHGRRSVGIELNPDYLPLISERIAGASAPLFEMEVA